MCRFRVSAVNAALLPHKDEAISEPTVIISLCGYVFAGLDGIAGPFCMQNGDLRSVSNSKKNGGVLDWILGCIQT